jgi:dipeptidyl aminopeptidase/acylaminoacyl peptidase
MASREVRPYGSWPSAISIEMAVSSALGLAEPRIDGDAVYWIEGRPQERGRQVVVRWSAESGARDVTPAAFNARTMAHEYGGGAWTVHAGTVYFANLDDGRLYLQVDAGEPRPITPAGPFRYGDLTFDPTHGRLLAVREDHRPVADATRSDDSARGPEPEDTLVAIDPATSGATVLARGYDFYSTPRPSPDGSRLAWLAWRHPNMPWDGTELWLADIDAGGSPRDERRLAGGSDESIVQPEWAPDGGLIFASDRSGWWNLYRLDEPGTPDADPRPLLPAEAEFAGPQWVFGMSWYGVTADGSVVAVARRMGVDELWRIPAAGGEAAQRIDVPDQMITGLRVGGELAVYVGGSPSQPRSVVLLEPDGGRRVLRQAFEVELAADHFSVPQQISFPTIGGATAYALYYPPANPGFEGPAGERPPLVVMSHGGPTSHANRSLDLSRQLFTSRGFAVVDVDYGGSTGYGREYMRRLDGQWGIVDVEDCRAAARYLAERGDVDPARMAIRGGSAGGYTTLCALVFHTDFACGASHFGVGDLAALARDTHKFESRYLDRLVAPYPEGIEVYRARSPLEHADRLRSPLIVLQGADDMVVSVDQAEQIVDVLRERRIPHAYLLFEGEGHGFRQAQNITRALEAELSFYAQIMGFKLADSFEPVKVEFL